MDRTIVSSRVDGRPAVILVVGVNGTGKTTTVARLLATLRRRRKHDRLVGETMRSLRRLGLAEVAG